MPETSPSTATAEAGSIAKKDLAAAGSKQVKMSGRKNPDNLDAYMNLGNKGIVRLVLLLLIEEGLQKQLASFRADYLATQPVKGHEELSLAGDGIMPIRDRAG